MSFAGFLEGMGKIAMGLLDGVVASLGGEVREQRPTSVWHTTADGRTFRVRASPVVEPIFCGNPAALANYHKNPNSLESKQLRRRIEQLGMYDDKFLAEAYGLVRDNRNGVTFYSPYHIRDGVVRYRHPDKPVEERKVACTYYNTQRSAGVICAVTI